MGTLYAPDVVGSPDDAGAAYHDLARLVDRDTLCPTGRGAAQNIGEHELAVRIKLRHEGSLAGQPRWRAPKLPPLVTGKSGDPVVPAI